MERIAVYLDSNVIIDVSEGRDDELLGLLFRSVYSGPIAILFPQSLFPRLQIRNTLTGILKE